MPNDIRPKGAPSSIRLPRLRGTDPDSLIGELHAPGEDGLAPGSSIDATGLGSGGGEGSGASVVDGLSPEAGAGELAGPLVSSVADGDGPSP